jgi:hypothetical protein
MSRKMSRIISRKESISSSSGWDAVIRDTEEAIINTKARLGRLREALRIFKDRRESGEPFPGERHEQSKAEAGDL